MDNNSDTLVPVLTASLIHQIHIAKALLSSRGIESYIFDRNIENIIGTAYVQGYKLEVNSADLEKAKEILAEVEENNE